MKANVGVARNIRMDKCARANCKQPVVVRYLGETLCKRHYHRLLDQKWGKDPEPEPRPQPPPKPGPDLSFFLD